MELKVIKKSKFYVPNYSQKLRVAAYIRVSTENENQIFSYESQIKYYTDLISRNNNWTLVDIYADYGLSGTEVSKRKEFQRMINDALEEKIDLIITKSISRFARNAENLLLFVRKLRYKNVAIYFEEEKINTLSLESEFLLTVLASVAEQESLNTSHHVKLGMKAHMKAGKVICGKKRYGYDYVNGEFIINKKEAKIVRKIFEMYVDGYSTGEIANYLNKRKILTVTGSKWLNGRIRDYIKNEFYVGDLLQGKSYIQRINGIVKQINNYTDDDKYLYPEHHEPIVSRDLFKRANELLKSRANSDSNCKTIFPQKLYCGCCGSAFNIHKCGINRTYICCSRIRYKCDVKPVREELIISAFQNSLKKLLKEKNRSEYYIDLKKYETEKLTILNRIESIYRIESRLADKLINKIINLGSYKEKLNKYDLKLEQLNCRKEEIEKILNRHREIISSLDKLFFVIDNEFDPKNFDIDFFNKIIDIAIIAGKSEKGTSMPYMIRFIYSDKEKLFGESAKRKAKEYLDSNKTKTILDFRNNYSFPIKQGKKKAIVKGTRVKFEIER